MVNVKKLRAKIIEKGLTITKISQKLDMDSSTFYRKLKNNGAFLTIKDVDKLFKILELDTQEANNIFFA